MIIIMATGESYKLSFHIYHKKYISHAFKVLDFNLLQFFKISAGYNEII